MALLRSLGSMHTLIFPGLSTMTKLLIHSVGSSTLVIICLLSRSRNLSRSLALGLLVLIAGHVVLGVRLGQWQYGSTSSPCI